MSIRWRKTLSLFMSLLLTIFSICQVQARAAVMPPVVAAPVTEMTDCHASDRAADTSVVDCHSACKHLQQHNDAAQKLPLPDLSPVLLTFLQPFALPLASLAGVDGYRPPDPLSTDPPASIRFQRFLN